MKDCLKDRHPEAIIAFLATNKRVKGAVLFGSRSLGTETITSDIDIALYGNELTLVDEARLAAAIDCLPIAQSVDLVRHHTIDHPPLLKHIQTHGVEWYRRPRAEAVAPGSSRAPSNAGTISKTDSN